MSKLYLSPSSIQTQTLPDITSAPSARTELLQLLQNEQDEAISLLEQSPFLAGLMVKYVTGGVAYRTTSNDKSHELGFSRTSYRSAREELEKLKETHKIVVEETDKARTEHSYERKALCAELELLREESKVQLEKALLQTEQISKRCRQLQDSLAKTNDELTKARQENADMKMEHDRTLSRHREQHQEAERRAADELEKSRAEINDLKMRDKMLLDIIASQRKSPTNVDHEYPIHMSGTGLNPSKHSAPATVVLKQVQGRGLKVPVPFPDDKGEPQEQPKGIKLFGIKSPTPETPLSESGPAASTMGSSIIEVKPPGNNGMSPKNPQKNTRQYRPEEPKGLVWDSTDDIIIDKSWIGTAGGANSSRSSTRESKKSDAAQTNSLPYRHSLIEKGKR